jgi:hypothetical protein
MIRRGRRIQEVDRERFQALAIVGLGEDRRTRLVDMEVVISSKYEHEAVLRWPGPFHDEFNE